MKSETKQELKEYKELGKRLYKGISKSELKEMYNQKKFSSGFTTFDKLWDYLSFDPNCVMYSEEGDMYVIKTDGLFERETKKVVNSGEYNFEKVDIQETISVLEKIALNIREGKIDPRANNEKLEITIQTLKKIEKYSK